MPTRENLHDHTNSWSRTWTARWRSCRQVHLPPDWRPATAKSSKQSLRAIGVTGGMRNRGTKSGAHTMAPAVAARRGWQRLPYVAQMLVAMAQIEACADGATSGPDAILVVDVDVAGFDVDHTELGCEAPCWVPHISDQVLGELEFVPINCSTGAVNVPMQQATMTCDPVEAVDSVVPRCQGGSEVSQAATCWCGGAEFGFLRFWSASTFKHPVPTKCESLDHWIWLDLMGMGLGVIPMSAGWPGVTYCEEQGFVRLKLDHVRSNRGFGGPPFCALVTGTLVVNFNEVF